MLETLAYAAATAAALAFVSALGVGLLRRRSVVRPLIDAESRRALWLRVPTLVLWLTAVFVATWHLNIFLSTVHEWVGYGIGAVVAAALAALGIGVALL